MIRRFTIWVLALLGAALLWPVPAILVPQAAHAATCAPVATLPADVAPSSGFANASQVIATFDYARQQEGCSVPLSINTTAFDSATPQMQMFMLFNAERQDRGLGALQLDTALLSQIDLNHSREMAQYDYFNHPSPINQPGSNNVFARLTTNPAINGHYSYVGENIAAGYSTAAAAVYGYMYQDSQESWGHRDNILGYVPGSNGAPGTFGEFNWVGVGVATGGYYGVYYSSDFLQSASWNPYTPPSAADTQAPTLSSPTVTGSGTVQVTNVQDTGASTGEAGVTGVVFYAGSITMDAYGNANTVVGTQNGTTWTASLTVPSGQTLHAVAVDGSGNYTDCAAGAGSCGSSGTGPALTSIPLTTGWNILGVPTTYYAHASSLVSDLQNQNAGLTVQIAATYVSGRYSLYIPGFSSDISLQQGQGVDVLTSTGGSWLPKGTPPGSTVGISVHAGWNLVSVPYPSSINASTVCSQITSCSEVATYSGGSWTTYTLSSGTTNFAINRDQGIMVLAGASSTWAASPPPAGTTPSTSGQAPAGSQAPAMGGGTGWRIQAWHVQPPGGTNTSP